MGGFILLLAAVVGANPANQVQAHMVDGSIVQGELQQLNNESITLQTSDGDKTLPINQVLSVTPQTTPAILNEQPTAWVELIDGSKLTATKLEIDGGSANLNLGSDKTAKFPTASI